MKKLLSMMVLVGTIWIGIGNESVGTFDRDKVPEPFSIIKADKF
ncbi:hypothetical protein [Solibacillus sp. FSL K6-1523]